MNTSRRDMESFVYLDFEAGHYPVVYLYPEGESKVPIIGDNARELADGVERAFEAAIKEERERCAGVVWDRINEYIIDHGTCPGDLENLSAEILSPKEPEA